MSRPPVVVDRRSFSEVVGTSCSTRQFPSEEAADSRVPAEDRSRPSTSTAIFTATGRRGHQGDGTSARHWSARAPPRSDQMPVLWGGSSLLPHTDASVGPRIMSDQGQPSRKCR